MRKEFKTEYEQNNFIRIKELRGYKIEAFGVITAKGKSIYYVDYEMPKSDKILGRLK